MRPFLSVPFFSIQCELKLTFISLIVDISVDENQEAGWGANPGFRSDWNELIRFDSLFVVVVVVVDDGQLCNVVVCVLVCFLLTLLQIGFN